MSYGKIHSTYWTDDKIQGLSDAAKLLGCYLLSSPHRNAIGCARIPLQYIAADLNWDTKKAALALSDLQRIGFITRDDDTGWTLVNNLMKYDPIRGAKAALGALRLTRAVPRGGDVYLELYNRLSSMFELELKDFGDERERTMEPPSIGDEKDIRSPEPSPDLTISITRADARAMDEDFEIWWKAYPRREAKGDALKAYRSARAEADAAILLAGAERYARSRIGEDPKFTKTPGPWLRAKKWLDEPPPRAPVSHAPRPNGNGGASGAVDTSADGPLAAARAVNVDRNKRGLPPIKDPAEMSAAIAAWRAQQSPESAPA